MTYTTPTLELIHQHRSIRAYRPEPVARELVTAIVEAGQRASTSSNLQLYSVVAVADAAKREQLAALCGGQEHIRQAPLFLAWIADRSRLERVCTRRGYTQVSSSVENFLVAAVDVAILMQTATLAAESLGLSMCYIGGIRNDTQAIIDLLELPPLTFPISGMTLGYAAADTPTRPRLDSQAILHWERYDSSAEKERLAAYDQAMIETGIYQGRQVPAPGDSTQSEPYGWQEHSARRAAQPMRVELGAVLRKQGFALE